MPSQPLNGPQDVDRVDEEPLTLIECKDPLACNEFVAVTDVIPAQALVLNDDYICNSVNDTPVVCKTSDVLCGTTRLFSIFNDCHSVVAVPGDSVAKVSDGRAAPLLSTHPFIPDKRLRTGVG